MRISWSTSTPSFLVVAVVSILYSLIVQTESSLLGGLLDGDEAKLTKRIIGVDSLVNATLQLRKNVLQDSTYLTELECSDSMFMSPFHHPVNFSLNSTFINNRIDPTCAWNFIGTEACLPKISCNLAPSVKCDHSYLEITDGVYGSQRFCDGNNPKDLMAANGLRDLYVTFKGTPEHKISDDTVFSCVVICGSRGQKHRKELKKVNMAKTDPKQCRCGAKYPNGNRIVNGEEAIKSEFPWLVALVEAGTRQPFCGGSLLNNRVILTAGHCFKGRFLNVNNLEVLVNAHHLDVTPNNALGRKEKPLPRKYDKETLAKLDEGNGSIRLIPEEIHVHPLYVSETNDFDTAVMLLETPLDFLTMSAFTRPVCLPPIPKNYLRTFGRRKATVAGWGLPEMEALGTPEKLQKLDVNVFMPSECKALYAHRVNRRMLCAGYREGGRDACAGDSGGPLVVEEKPNLYLQVGAVSWGDGCAREANPGVYFRTTESGQWVRHISNKYGAAWCVNDLE